MRKKLTLMVALLVAAVGAAWAQMPEPLPKNPKVRYGRLSNGLTYYIQHNNLPEKHAEFYIAQRVGSVLEEESQRGLAHFLEHMAFNGTKNFPGKRMLEYLQDNGVKFGTNVNAYTSIDETVYNISDVPTDESHPGIVDSCLLILHDWSGFISLEEEEIDNERGVIHEEWRSRNSAGLRLYQNHILPKMLPGNRYAERMPIGLMEVVDHFTYDELRNYYHKWYRPDLQGIMIVGDVDVDEVEQKIKTLWQDIETPADAAERIYYPVEDNVEPLVCVASDPELTSNHIAIMYKREPLPKSLEETIIGYTFGYMHAIITQSVNMRLTEIAQQADAPFQAAGISFGRYLLTDTKDNFEIQISVKPGRWHEGLLAAVKVVKSAVEYGLTQAEVDRAKAMITSSMENAYNERDKQKNRQIVEEMKRNFLSNEPMPGIEAEWEMLPQVLEQLSVQVLNQYLAEVITEENLAMYMMAQQREDNILPTEEELLAAYKEAMAQKVEGYEEEAVARHLVASLPKPGKVKKEAEGPFGSTVWTLSNGVRVVWKATDFKKDQISMTAFSEGGSQRYRDELKANREFMGSLYQLGGVGDFNPIALNKALAGKKVSVSASINNRSESIDGTTTPKDLRTMFELTYLLMTAPRQDQDVYEAWRSRVETAIKNQLGTPQKIKNDSLISTFYPGVELVRPLEMADFEQIDYDRAFQLGKERFANAADFTFYFIGNIDADSLRALCCQYLATLPANRKGLEKAPEAILISPGSRENRYDLVMEQPKTEVTNVFSLYDQPWNLKDELTVAMLGQVVDMAFVESIREREGGVYSPSARASFNSQTGYMQFIYNFDTGADKVARIDSVAYAETCHLAEPGHISNDNLQRVRDYMTKRYNQNQRENNYWQNLILVKDHYGTDTYTNYIETLNSITTSDLEQMLVRFLQGDRVQLISNGIEKTQ